MLHSVSGAMGSEVDSLSTDARPGVPEPALSMAASQFLGRSGVVPEPAVGTEDSPASWLWRLSSSLCGPVLRGCYERHFWNPEWEPISLVLPIIL